MTGQYSEKSPNHAAVKPLFVAALLAALNAGCATTPWPKEISSVQVCAGEECREAQSYSTNQILHALNLLFQANDGAGFRLCRSKPETRDCTGDDIGYFVLGGFIPGRGSSNSGNVSQVKFDAASQLIRYVMSMKLRFLGIPLVCVDHDAVLAVRSVHDIVMTDNDYFCNWMVVGIMSASFSFVIDWVDFDKGRLGGYWKHGVTGTGIGRGHGYGLIIFPRAMPRGENWLAGENVKETSLESGKDRSQQF